MAGASRRRHRGGRSACRSRSSRRPRRRSLAAVVVLVAAPRAAASRGQRRPRSRRRRGDEPIHVRNAPRLLRVLVPIAMLGHPVRDPPGLRGHLERRLPRRRPPPAGRASPRRRSSSTWPRWSLGRLTNDRWVDRWGSATVVRAGAVIGGGGPRARDRSPAPLGAPLLAFAGFARVGLGSSPMFPVMIGAADRGPASRRGTASRSSPGWSGSG